VIHGNGGPAECGNLAGTNPDPPRGLKTLLSNVDNRLTGRSGAVAPIAKQPEFPDAKLILTGHVKVAAFDGENTDSANGRGMGNAVLAHYDRRG